jgi:hypothetical protein
MQCGSQPTKQGHGIVHVRVACVPCYSVLRIEKAEQQIGVMSSSLDFSTIMMTALAVVYDLVGGGGGLQQQQNSTLPLHHVIPHPAMICHGNDDDHTK